MYTRECITINFYTKLSNYVKLTTPPVLTLHCTFSCQSAILMRDNDMMVDAALFLWSKCKPHFQRILSSSLENCKQLLNDVFVNRVSCNLQ